MTETEKDLWKKVNRYVPWLRFIPFIKMVAVCNNLSFGKVDVSSDIDLFIVAKRGRLFTVRIFVTIFFQIFAVRRHGNKEAGRFCLSFFIDDSVMDLESIAIKNDIYLAFWINNLKPIIDSGCALEFIGANHWIDSYFYTEVDLDMSYCNWRPSGIFNFLIPNFFEKLMRSWQLRRARQKAKLAGPESSLIISSHILKFHNVDRRSYYRDQWIEKFGTKKLNNQDFSSL